MPAPTRRSKAEREMFAEDHTRPRTADNIVQTISLTPPDRIIDNPLKLDTWNYICNDLAARSLLSSSYIMPITMLVDNIVSYNEYIAMLEASGPVAPVMDKTGEHIVRYVENPLFSIVKRTEAIIIKLCEKFGLDPRDSVYVTNPDIKTQAIEAQATDSKRKGINYFAS